MKKKKVKSEKFKLNTENKKILFVQFVNFIRCFMGQIKKITNFPYAWLSCQSAARNFQVVQIHWTVQLLKNFRINFQAIY